MKRILPCTLFLSLLVLASTTRATDIESLNTYVSRIGKLIEIVSDRPNLNYEFVVTEDQDPQLTMDREKGVISISYGLLKQLSDEAELAATLALAIGRLADYINIDRESAKFMSYAGYDPQALLDIQEQYFFSANLMSEHWLTAIYPTPLSAGTIAANRVMIKKYPEGLQRGAEDYYHEIND